MESIEDRTFVIRTLYRFRVAVAEYDFALVARERKREYEPEGVLGKPRVA